MTPWLFVSDVDDTLLGKDDALARLAAALESATNTITTAWNSSRPCASLRQSLATVPQLPTPDYLIGALGTEIQHGASGEPLTEYTQYLNQGWQRDEIAAIIAELGYTPHADEYQTPLKVSYDSRDPNTRDIVLARLDEAGLQAKVIYSSGKNLDILPVAAGKGNVINWLYRQVGVDAAHVAVSGDSGNDVEMFVSPYKGIVVGNADTDLKSLQGEHIYQAQATHADGVLEGLKYWQVL